MVIGIIALLLCLTLFWVEGYLQIQLFVVGLAMVASSVFYTWYDTRAGQKKNSKLDKALEHMRTHWIPVAVSPNDIEIKSSTSVNAVGHEGNMASSGFVAAFQPMAIIDAAKYDDGRAPGTETVSQSVLVLRKYIEGQERLFYSHLIAKDATTISFLLHGRPSITIYINPANPQECLFDVFLD